jgi:hypothetical protein
MRRPVPVRRIAAADSNRGSLAFLCLPAETSLVVMPFLYDVGQGGMDPIMWNRLNPTGAPCEDLPTLASYDG